MRLGLIGALCACGCVFAGCSGGSDSNSDEKPLTGKVDIKAAPPGAVAPGDGPRKGRMDPPTNADGTRG